MEALEPRPPPYDESRIDWRMFANDPLAHQRVSYEPLQLALHCRTLGITEEVGRRHWRQLMYFFAALSVMIKAGSAKPESMPHQPPPLLEGPWHMFRLQSPDEAVNFCTVFFGGQDVTWRRRYREEHRLTPDRLGLIRRTAEMIGFEIDDELWKL